MALPGVDLAERRALLAGLEEQVRPGALARERLLPVVPELAPLLPLGGLARGSVVATRGPAATSLALALVAGASASGSWLGVVGMPSLGLSAAYELGVALERLFLVAEPPPRQWGEIVAAVADGADLVLTRATGSLSAGDVRRVERRLSSRGATLVVAEGEGGPSGFSPDLVLTTDGVVWEGIEPARGVESAGSGWGRLVARRLTVEVAGRRAARPRRTELWLPGPSGRVERRMAERLAPLHVAATDELELLEKTG
jgi:hypothetical protein